MRRVDVLVDEDWISVRINSDNQTPDIELERVTAAISRCGYSLPS